MTSSRLLAPVLLVCLGNPLFAKDLARADEGAGPDVQRLSEAAEAAGGAFRPLGEKDLLRAENQLRKAIERLEERLAVEGDNGRAWAEYLRLDELREQLDADAVDLSVLEAVYRRFNAGHYGLNRLGFAEVREALQAYTQVARAMQTPELHKAYAQYVETLASYLRSYAEEPNAEQAVQIGDAIAWLESIGQAPALVSVVREELARPNLFATVSQRLAAAGIDEPVDDTEPVRDIILGTDIYGTGHSVGRVTAGLVPDDHHAVFDITYLGVTETRNRGYNGPVVIHSRGTTGIGARKRLWLNATGLHSHPARANATTKSHLLDIQPQRGGRLVERIAWRKAFEQKHLAEAIASQHAATRAERRMDDQAAEMLAETNHAFEHEFRKPLVEHNLFPKKLRFKTTDDALRVVWLQAGSAQLAAPGGPPPAVEPADLALRIHESMINNAARTTLAGLTLNDTELRHAVEGFLGRLPEQLEPVPGDEPWGISFDRAQPVEVRFADGGFRVTIRGRRYFQADQAHPGMNVSAGYRIVRDDAGFRAVREGEVEVVPPGLADDQRVGARYQVVRTLLIRRFTPIFRQEFPLEDLELPGRWAELGAIPVVRFEADNGWLTIAWKLPAGE